MIEKKYVIISIILIVLINALLIFCKFGKIRNEESLVPTGNIDVFDIDVFNDQIIINKVIEKDDNTNEENETENESEDENTNIISKIKSNSGYLKRNRIIKTNDKKNNEENAEDSTEEYEETEEEYIQYDKNGETIPKYNEETDKNVLGKVFVDDNQGNYLYQERLNIFTNSAYKNKIAPGVSNVYYFVVHNSKNTDVEYNIQMYEESEYPINMKYRLKSGGGYTIGNDKTWVTANELVTSFRQLNKGTSESYSLEWKWFDDDENDTIAGKKMESEYKLNIRFLFKAVNS